MVHATRFMAVHAILPLPLLRPVRLEALRRLIMTPRRTPRRHAHNPNPQPAVRVEWAIPGGAVPARTSALPFTVRRR
ncbi:MAG: hypothetical protein KDJ28_07380 [Candidatus Competibacteraceae bacterium]|nr:hypothetical protein [Candidatus Competibacteraceae bacterium]